MTIQIDHDIYIQLSESEKNVAQYIMKNEEKFYLLRLRALPIKLLHQVQRFLEPFKKWVFLVLPNYVMKFLLT